MTVEPARRVGRFSPEFMAELRHRTDIVSLIGERVSLRPAGRELVGLCPFHEEKTPSFSVSPERGLYHCHGCHAGGDAIEFVMRSEGCAFADAVATLAARAGMTVPADRPATPAERQREARLGQLAEVLDATWRHFRDNLVRAEGAPAIAYLRQRGVDGRIAERFGLGYATDDWEALGRALTGRFGSEALVAAGVSVQRKGRAGAHDLFHHRLMFPIWDERGRIVGFGGRALRAQDSPKYLNSPETLVFHKRRVLYGWHLARPAIARGKRAVVVEGYMDALTCHQYGFEDVVAGLGTALSAEQAGMLSRTAESVVLAYDADQAGDAATERGMALLQGTGAQVFVADIPAGQDPDDLLRSAGPSAWAAALEGALPLIRSLVRRSVGRGGLVGRSLEDRWQLARRVVPFLARAGAGTRREYTEWVARELMVDPRELERAVGAEIGPTGEHRNSRSWNATQMPRRIMRSGADAAEEAVLAACLQSGAQLHRLASELSIHDFGDPRHKALAGKLLDRFREAGPQGVPGEELLDELDEEERSVAARLLARPLEESVSVLDSYVRTMRRARLRREIEELRAELRRLAASGSGLGSPEVQGLTRRLTELTAELARSARGDGNGD
jgi:DNA primase